MTDKMREAATQALEALEKHCTAFLHHEEAYVNAIAALRTALAEQPAEQEPVAYDRLQRIYDSATHAAAMAVFITRMDAEQPDADDMGVSGWLQEAENRVRGRATQPLESVIYTAPQPRKRLIDEEIKAFAMEAFDSSWDADDETLVNKYGHGVYLWRFVDFTRAVERAHGITGESK